MKFIIMAPARVQSGGPELAHQLCYELLKKGYDSYMYYTFSNVSGPGDEECAERYRKYGTRHVLIHEEADDADNIVIVPEELSDRCFTFKKARVILWWMSVDNFYRGSKEGNVNLIDDKVILHLYQSEYARCHLIEKGVDSNKIMKLSDYIDDAYGQFIFPAEYRKSIALFNPKKGLKEITPLIERTKDLDWRPLIGMSQEEMILAMQLAKIYVDFGNHPGKDRIPREAALCGCCVVTNRKGSAAYYNDIPIDDEYKIDTEVVDYDEIADKVISIIDNYSDRFSDFDKYRQIIKQEKSQFIDDITAVLERVNAKEKA